MFDRWRRCTSLDLDEALSDAGPPAEAFARLWAKLWRQPHVDAQTLELCRLTLARLHDDDAEMAADNPHVAAGDLGERRALVLAGHRLADGALGEAEQAILTFAEYYWLDAAAIPDESAGAVKDVVGEGGLVFLIEALGVLDGRIRAARCLRGLATIFARESAVAV